MVYGTITAYNVVNPATGNHFGGSLASIPVIGQMGYIALTAFVINLIVAAILTFVFNAMKVSAGVDETIKGDYFADEGDPRVEKHLETGIHIRPAPRRQRTAPHHRGGGSRETRGPPLSCARMPRPRLRRSADRSRSRRAATPWRTASACRGGGPAPG